MKRISLLVSFLAIVLPAQFVCAQSFTLGVRSGISIPNLSASGSETNPLNEGYSSRIGPDEAIFGEYHVSSAFSIEAMLEYSSQGGKKDGTQAFPTPSQISGMLPPGQAPTYLYADFKSEAKLNYLLVPILAKYNWKLGSNSPRSVYAAVGPFAGFLLAAHQVTSGSSMYYSDDKQTPLPFGLTEAIGTQSFDTTNNIKNQLNTFNFGVSGNVGFAYRFGKNKIFIEGGGNYGFLNIQKGTANGKNNTGAGTVALGYGYTFWK
ncbi:MAG TPA: porin family protein [Hanamia sp.]